MKKESPDHKPIFNIEESADCIDLTICENNSPIWGYIINQTLEKAEEGKIEEYRYRSILLKKDGKELVLAQGIWNLEEALEIKDRIKDNKLETSDYWDYEDKDRRLILFSCDTKVFNYLVEKKVFVEEDKTANGKKDFRLYYPNLLGEKNKTLLEIDIHSMKQADKKDYMFLLIDIFTRSNENNEEIV